MLNYYAFKSHEDYLSAVQYSAKVELEVTGEAYILSPQMAERVIKEWRKEGDMHTSLRPIAGRHNRYETYRTAQA